MESGLTRDGRATTVSHTRFGRVRRARLFPLYLGASQPFLRMYGILARGRGRRAGCGVCPGVHGGYGGTAPGARRNRAGSERPYTKVPPPCQSPLRASSAVARARAGARTAVYSRRAPTR